MTLVQDEVETPGDISGLVYTPATNEWEFKLVGELKNLEQC